MKMVSVMPKATNSARNFLYPMSHPSKLRAYPAFLMTSHMSPAEPAKLAQKTRPPKTTPRVTSRSG